MILRSSLVVFFALVFQHTKAQILEEMTVDQLGKHIDSLIANGEIVKANDEFYTYSNFFSIPNHILLNNEALLEIQKRIQTASLVLSGKSDEQLFELNRAYLSQILKTKNYQKAILILNRFNKIKEAKVLTDSVIRILPFDTVNVYKHSFPVQLFSVPQRELYDYNYDKITDDFTIYRKVDSSLFTGIIISRNKTVESMMNDLANLNYDKYVNGQRIERKAMLFGPTIYLQKDLYRNDLFFGYDSNHYRLFYKVITNRTDTIRTYFFGANEELIREDLELKQIDGANKSIKIVEYNSDGSIKKWKELAPISEKHSQYDSYWCWVNQFGDTISDGFEVVKDQVQINQERTLNANGDTIYLSRTVNSFIDGLQIENRYSSDGFNFELRSVFDNGTIIDILSDSVLYFNEDWKIITKEDYILLMNQGGDDFLYLNSGIFNEYFPDVDFKPYPYFISVSDIGHKNYKKFKKAVRKYFKVKI